MGKIYFGDKNNIAHEVKNIYIGINNPKKHIFSDEYTELEYLENNNYEYIDSEVVLTPTIKIEADFQITEKKYGFETFIFGNYPNGTDICKLRAGINTNNSFNTGVGTVTYSQTSNIFARTTVTGIASSGTSPNTTIIIFGSRRKSAYEKIEGIGKIKLYSLKIYDNNILIRNFIPCKRNSDSINGLYDVINNIFYTNANSIPSDYQQVEYIQSTGSQYIDTNCLTEENTGSYITFSTINSLSTSGAGAIFGVDLGSGTRYYLETWTQNERKGNFWIGTSYAGSDAKINLDTKLTIGHSTITKTVATNDNSYVTSITTPISSSNIYIFAYNNSDSPTSSSKTKIYYLSLFNKYDKIHEYIPVIRKSDNKPGLYDTISGSCLFNKGEEDDFLYGNLVNDFTSGSIVPEFVARKIKKGYIELNRTAKLIYSST